MGLSWEKQTIKLEKQKWYQMVEAPECQVKEFGLLIFMDFCIFSSIKWHYSIPFQEVVIYICVLCVCAHARRSNQSILNIHSLGGLMLKLKLQYFGHLM